MKFSLQMIWQIAKDKTMKLKEHLKEHLTLRFKIINVKVKTILQL